MIRLPAAVQITDGALDALIGMEAIGRDDEAVIAARHPVIDTDAVTHEAGRSIARISCALGDRNIVLTQLDRRPLAEDTCMLRIHSRLDRRERGIGVLKYGEMLIEDRATRKETCCVRHMLCKRSAQHLPWQCIHEDIQHELFTCGAVPEADRRPDNKVLCRGESRIFIQSEIIRRCGIQPDIVIHRLCLRREHLPVRCAKDGDDCLCTRLDGDCGLLRRTLCTHDVKGKIPADIVRKS